jgi:hypothetical protein
MDSLETPGKRPQLRSGAKTHQKEPQNPVNEMGVEYLLSTVEIPGNGQIWVLVVARLTSRKSAVRARHRPLKEEPAGSGDRRASIRARSDNLGAGEPSLSPNASSACALRKSCSGRPGLARIAGPRPIQGDSCKSIAFRLEHAARGDAQLTFGPFRACSGLSERSDGFHGEVDGGSELRVGS